MQNSLFQAICRMGIFMICARAIIHFRPQEVYEKYLRFLAGVMVLIQLFMPVGQYLMGEDWQEGRDILGRLRQELEQGMEEAARQAAEADALLEQMTLEEVRKQLEAAQEAGEQEEKSMSENEAADGGTGLGEEEDIINIKAIEPVSIGENSEQ